MRTTSKLGIALRRKFKTPREALRALGLDQSLLNVPSLAMDGAIDEMGSRAELEKLLATVLSGHQYQRACELLNGAINAEHEIAGNVGEGENIEAEDDEGESEEVLRARRKLLMKKIADWLSTEKGLDEFEIAASLADFPKNGIEHVGGAVDDDLERVMKDRRRRMATDAKQKRQAFDSRYPQAARLSGTALETSYGDPIPSRRAVDSSADGFNDRFPEAARIKYGHAL